MVRIPFYKTISTFIFLVLVSSFAVANEGEAHTETLMTDSASISLTVPLETHGAEVAHQEAAHGDAAKSGEYDPVPMIMHHIADANDFNVLNLGHHHAISIPLPIILYNLDKGTFFTGLSSMFHIDAHGNSENEVDGYKMEHSRVVPVDGSKYIDFSITKNVLTMLLVACIMFVVFFSAASAYKNRKGQAPKGVQGIIEPIVVFIKEQIADPNLGKKSDKYMPYLLTAFFFIWINNMLGLVPIFPGGANVTGNIAVTFTLAFFTFLLINFSGNKHYWGHIFWMPGVPLPMKPFLAIVEVIGIFTKPIALMIRLFANITAGHIIVLSLASLIFVFGKAGESFGGAMAGASLAVPFSLLIGMIELLVAFLQAFIFTMLSAVFIGLAIEEHAEHH